MVMGFGVLGAVEAYVDGRVVDLGHTRQQCVLVSLLVDANEPVPVERLADRVWGDRPPQRARNALYSYLSRLRRILGDGDGLGIRRERGGYVLAVDQASVDLHRFDLLLAQARASREDERARAVFERALGLWRGVAFAGLDTEWINTVRESLHQQRFEAELEYTKVRLRLGRHAGMLAELADRARAHPLDERASGQLMLALHRSGRTGDALAQYQVSRRQLADELGVDPGPELQRLHREILCAGSPVQRTAPALSAGSTLDAGPAPAVIPRQLPARPAQFTGRAGELSRLTHTLPAPDDADAAMVLWAIDGTGGVGKTYLALRWAHEHVERFPDGQLYVNLRGFGPSGAAMDPAEAIRGFLDALGVPPQRIPAGLDAKTALYRSSLAGKRVLVVLDNARDVPQVRPLLPGSAGCLVVVTSRNRLTGLVATDGARPLSLDLLTVQEARDLLTGRLGGDRVAAEPEAAQEIIARCARLPLALAVAAARAAAHPDLPLTALAADLHHAAGALDTLHCGDPATDVRAVLSWSHQALSTDAATTFRLLGLHPGPDITLPAAASLTGLAPRRVRELLAELTGAHLLTEPSPGRYAFHDLLRAYALEQAHSEESDETCDAAVHRMLEHYLHTAHAAALRLGPRMDAVTLTEPGLGVVLDEQFDQSGARAWFTAEHKVLLCVIEHAHADGFNRQSWQLAWACTNYLNRTNHWHDLTTIQHTALSAALRSADRTGQAHALHGLGLAESGLGRLDNARARLLSALDLFDEIGNQSGKARTHKSLGWIEGATGRHRQALEHAQRTLELCRAAADAAGQATALNDVGWYHAELGEHREALACCQQALILHQRAADAYGQALTWDSLGYIHRHLRDYEQAITCYQRSLELLRHTGDAYCEATSLTYMGDAHLDAGDLDAARQAWRLALRALDRLNHPDAQRVRAKLRHPDPAAATRDPH